LCKESNQRKHTLAYAPAQKDVRVPCASRLDRASSTGHPWPDDEGFGILPRPRLRAAMTVQDWDARRNKRGFNVKSKNSPCHPERSEGSGFNALLIEPQQDSSLRSE
jgi:hypothetical protein